MIFDVLKYDGEDIAERILSERFAQLVGTCCCAFSSDSYFIPF